MSHTPIDERLRRVAESTGATCTWRVIHSHPLVKLVGLTVEVLDYGGDEVCFINPVTQTAEMLTARNVGGPVGAS